MASQTNPSKNIYFVLFNFTITKICDVIGLAEDGTRMGGIKFQLSSSLYSREALRKFRSSHPEVFLKKSVLKICNKFTGEYPCRSVISVKLLQLY